MSPVSTIKMTARQFLELGEDPSGVRLELVDGEVAVSPSPVPRHSYTFGKLWRLLIDHVEGHDLGRVYGDVDTILAQYDVRRPDILYFRKSLLKLVGEKAMEGAPDLCVEILSPGSGRIDRVDKFKQYRAARVANYWIVDPLKHTIEAFVLRRGRYVAAGHGRGGDVVNLPPFLDLDIPLAQIWHPD
jgi:Uma2 family endonuclease